MAIDVTPLALSGVKLITPQRFGDARGFFSETYNRDAFVAADMDMTFVQDNHSLSRTVGTIRGLHFQAPPRAQDKLVRCGRGRLFDVAVDIRKGSPTFGRWVGAELSFENGLMLLVPAGFAHGFVTLEPDTEIVYKCSDTYSAQSEGAIRWDDPDVGIDWPLNGVAPQLSAKDAVAPFLAAIDSPFTFEAN